MVFLSIQGFLRTILILIAVIVILRFVGKLMIIKRNIAAEKAESGRRETEDKLKANAENNYGKVTLSKRKIDTNDAGDFDSFEEVE